ncbi:hypothetical protein FRC17_004769 [Serendipita sp. 399]|nr:hypothetical protein FRC17_004769 [Serendipita sp. 399]
MSASSSASSQSGSPLDSNTKGDSPAVPATQAPNPWVEQATLNSCPPPASADNPSGSPESPTINRINQLGKEGALSRIHGRKRSEHDVPVQTNETAATQHDGSELDRTQFDSSAPAPDLVAGLTNSMYLANSSNGMTRIDDNSQEDNVKEVAISATFERASLQPTGSLIIDSDVPAIQEDLSILHSNQKSSPLPIPVPIPSRNPPSTMLQIPITPNSIKSSSSHLESSHIPHSLAESTTWEKVEGIYDEWQELSNPREEVVVMSESDGSDNEDDLDDEAEWEASRKVGANGNAMADSAFLPSVQRRRRVAATATKEETGRATPTPSTGRRVENPKPHGGELSEDALASSYFMATGPAPSHVPKRLTPQQEQIVAELKRARITPGEVKSYSRQRDNLRHGSPAVLLPSIW